MPTPCNRVTGHLLLAAFKLPHRTALPLSHRTCRQPILYELTPPRRGAPDGRRRTPAPPPYPAPTPLFTWLRCSGRVGLLRAFTSRPGTGTDFAHPTQLLRTTGPPPRTRTTAATPTLLFARCGLPGRVPDPTTFTTGRSPRRDYPPHTHHLPRYPGVVLVWDRHTTTRDPTRMNLPALPSMLPPAHTHTPFWTAVGLYWGHDAGFPFNASAGTTTTPRTAGGFRGFAYWRCLLHFTGARPPFSHCARGAAPRSSTPPHHTTVPPPLPCALLRRHLSFFGSALRCYIVSWAVGRFDAWTTTHPAFAFPTTSHPHWHASRPFAARCGDNLPARQHCHPRCTP